MERCRCQIFYVSFGDMTDEDSRRLDLTSLPSRQEDSVTSQEDACDTFTLLHHEVKLCANSVSECISPRVLNLEQNMTLSCMHGTCTFVHVYVLLLKSQYLLLSDVINNLLLFVDSKRKERSERQQRLKFKIQLDSIKDRKIPIIEVRLATTMVLQSLTNIA